MEEENNMTMREYFGKHWVHCTSYEYSWDSLINKINDLKPKRVLDIGCGENYFKGKIDNLFGIDPYNDAACSMIGIEDLGDHLPYDVIMALGSINFGDEANIDSGMRQVDKLLKADGHLFMRLNPGLDHHWAESESAGLIFFPWTKEKIKQFALAFGYTIEDWQEEYNVHGALRYYVHMIKL